MILRRASDGSRIEPGRELGRGGEGAVYEIVGESFVAKIYHKAPTPAKGEKLRVMVRAGTPELLRMAAWPIDVIEDESHGVRGFLMPRVAAREDAHQLYSPKSRRRAFPDADFRFLVRAATNIARAFASMHAEGHVIGDVNHGNALIGRDATVVLIDCDSFQVRDRDGRVFTCDVGVPLFTAPELQGQGFRGLERSATEDLFGLAVLLFHVLYLGRHPFAGVYKFGDVTIEQAIAQSLFAYGAASARLGMSPPPGTLPLKTFGGPIADLFERAFAPPGKAFRPTASEWIAALVDLESQLQPCDASPRHFHPRDRDCCWCDIEQQTHVRLFGPASILEDVGQGVIDSLWNAIRAVPGPPIDPMHPAPAARRRAAKWMPDETKSVGQRFGIAGVAIASMIIGGLTNQPWFALGGLLGLLFSLGNGWDKLRARLVRKHARVASKLEDARARWQSAAKSWNAQCSTARFNKQVERLSRLRDDLAGWQKRRRRELRALGSYSMDRARDLFLEGKRIDASGLALPPDEIAFLAKYGIETAQDVIRATTTVVQMIPAAHANDVADWASQLSHGFSFDPAAPPAELVAQLDRQLAEQRQQLMAELRAGPATLERTCREILETRERMEPDMQAAIDDLRRAEQALGD